MADFQVYLRYPQERILPGVADWILQARSMLVTEMAWTGWDIESEAYNANGAFSVQSLADKVKNIPGPVFLIEPVQKTAKELLRERLRVKAPVLIERVGNADELWHHFNQARERYLAFCPVLPRRFVAAVLIVRKLIRGHYWGGKEKGYLYADDLAKGRGVDEGFADIAADVANDLLIKNILIRKPSKGRAKYALNPNRKDIIHLIGACTTTQEFPEPDEIMKRLKHSLVNDNAEVAAALLKDLVP
jgi:hypothetical protein